MRRRDFILGAAGLVMSPAIVRAQGIQTATVARPERVIQKCPEWCWAASASMIFAHLGHPMDQEKIVAAEFSGLVCQPAQPGRITHVLNSPWTDDLGQQFRPHVNAGYDQLGGVNTIGFGSAGNSFILNELMQNRMLLYGNTHHCMAIVEADYFPTQWGPDIRRVMVLDPWPYNPPEHPLSNLESRAAFVGGEMMYLAAVRI
jgi:hypothetical protein